MVVSTHRQGPSVVACAVSLIPWRPSHGEQLWRAKLWWQHRKHGHGLENLGLSANPSRWSSKTNGSLGGSRLDRQPTVSRAWLLSSAVVFWRVPNELGSRHGRLLFGE